MSSIPERSFDPWSAADVFRSWLPFPYGAPKSLVQPILPGWTLNINSNNSSAPQTEVNVVAKHSYGRQIGRMSEALRALIVEVHGKSPKQKHYADFLSLCADIEKVKGDSAQARLEQIKSDLALLEQRRPQEYARLRDELKRAIGDGR